MTTAGPVSFIKCSEISSCDFVELFEEISRISCKVILRVGVFNYVCVLSWHASVNLNLAFAEVLDANFVKRKSLNARVRGLGALREESDESGDVFFEFREVKCYVILIELHVFVVLHGRGDGQVEL